MPAVATFHAICFALDWILFPGLRKVEVKEPVFMVGHARSGTTLLSRLMTYDADRFSYFLYWEMFFPSLLQKKLIKTIGSLDEKWLGRMINKRLVAWDDKKYGPYRHMHDMSLWNSEEDQFVKRGAFVTQQWSMDIPMMEVIDIFHVDEMPRRKRRRWMHHYHECVKRQVLLNGGNKMHLSKNPVMSGWVEALIETFPDARIVVMRPAAVHTANDGILSPSNPKFDPFWARVNEAGITVVVHASDSGYTTHGYVEDGFSASGVSGASCPSREAGTKSPKLVLPWSSTCSSTRGPTTCTRSISTRRRSSGSRRGRRFSSSSVASGIPSKSARFSILRRSRLTSGRGKIFSSADPMDTRRLRAEEM